MVSFEIGFAIGQGIPVFLQEKPSQFLDLDEPIYSIIHSLKVCTIEEAIEEVKKEKDVLKGK